MDDDLRQRLSRVESEFLCAMSGDLEAMATFQQSFLSLKMAIDTGLRSNAVDDQTLQLAHSTTSRITLMTEAFLELQIQSDSLSATFSDKVEEIIKERDRFSDTSLSEDTGYNTPADSLPDTSCSIPSCIEEAYQWFLNNLHDPFPSQEVKASIARSSKTSLYAINRWFTRVRSKVGWSEISRDYFNNDRRATVQAARRAFKADNSEELLPADIFLRFYQMRTDAEDLYQHKFEQSKLSRKLSVLIQNFTAEISEDADVERAAVISEQQKKKAEARRIQRRRDKEIAKRKAIQSYPSPDRSIHGSPTPSNISLPSFEESDSETENSPPPLNAGCKRRRSSSTSSGSSFNSSIDESNTRGKRHRPNDPETCAVSSYIPLTPKSCAGDLAEETPDCHDKWMNAVFEAIARLPQPPGTQRTYTSTPDVSSFSAISPPSTPSPSTPRSMATLCQKTPAASSSSRKRRLLEADCQTLHRTKRLRSHSFDPHCDSVLDLSSHNNLDPWMYQIGSLGKVDSSEALSVSSADYRPFLKTPNGRDEVADMFLSPGSMSTWEEKADGIISPISEESFDFPTPITPKEETPRSEICSPILSIGNALNLCVDTLDFRQPPKFSKLGLCSVSQDDAFHQLRTFGVPGESAPATVHCSVKLEPDPISSSSLSINWFTNLRDVQFSSQKMRTATPVSPAGRPIFSSRAFLGAGYFTLSGRERQTKVAHIRTQEAEITLLRQRIV